MDSACAGMTADDGSVLKPIPQVGIHARPANGKVTPKTKGRLKTLQTTPPNSVDQPARIFRLFRRPFLIACRRRFHQFGQHQFTQLGQWRQFFQTVQLQIAQNVSVVAHNAGRPTESRCPITSIQPLSCKVCITFCDTATPRMPLNVASRHRLLVAIIASVSITARE